MEPTADGLAEITPDVQSGSPMVDEAIAAGDAFVAGYLSGLLDRLPLEERLHRAALLGAFCVASHGDWEGLPTRSELDLPNVTPGFTDR